MFFLISGAAASGKSTVANKIGNRLMDIECHDADEKPFCEGFDRQKHLIEWLQMALNCQKEGNDFLLTSHSPFGELLACPLSRQLQGISACLIDCGDLARIRRMRARGIDPRWAPNQHILNWASWHRMHAIDPQWEQHVIVQKELQDYSYETWTDWKENDPRWNINVIDTTDIGIEQVLDRIVQWVAAEREKESVLIPANKWWESI